MFCAFGSHRNRAAAPPLPGAEFQELAKHPEVDLYPEDLRSAIDEARAPTPAAPAPRPPACLPAHFLCFPPPHR